MSSVMRSEVAARRLSMLEAREQNSTMKMTMPATVPDPFMLMTCEATSGPVMFLSTMLMPRGPADNAMNPAAIGMGNQSRPETKKAFGATLRRMAKARDHQTLL